MSNSFKPMRKSIGITIYIQAAALMLGFGSIVYSWLTNKTYLFAISALVSAIVSDTLVRSLRKLVAAPAKITEANKAKRYNKIGIGVLCAALLWGIGSPYVINFHRYGGVWLYFAVGLPLILCSAFLLFASNAINLNKSFGDLLRAIRRRN